MVQTVLMSSSPGLGWTWLRVSAPLSEDRRDTSVQRPKS